MTTQPPEIDWEDLRSEPPADDEPAIERRERPGPDFEMPATSDAAAQSERDRVLRHPDIAARLCEPPLRYSRPDVWNGYIPPDTWQGKHNDSPQRVALLDIITAAVKADQEGEGG